MPGIARSEDSRRLLDFMSYAPTLLVLAAGMGSRYGGLKQLDPMGPSGEIMLDYAVYDARRAGFGKVVFVIRRDIEAAFRERIGRHYEERIDIEYAFQELDDLPAGYRSPEGRTRPWGTGQAVWSARQCVDNPFAVINADDFYGREAYALLANQLTLSREQDRDPVAMVTYSLAQTLSEHGAVNRGLCREIHGMLASVEEVTAIQKRENGSIEGCAPSGKTIQLEPHNPVSMNFWGFPETIFDALGEAFHAFLKKNGHDIRAEFYLPAFVDQQIQEKGLHCRLLHTGASWFGVTYPEDRHRVRDALRQRHHSGEYPRPLFP
jgi:UTP-glucose-1-phosphate uridylyltransferase